MNSLSAGNFGRDHRDRSQVTIALTPETAGVIPLFAALAELAHVLPGVTADALPIPHTLDARIVPQEPEMPLEMIRILAAGDLVPRASGEAQQVLEIDARCVREQMKVRCSPLLRFDFPDDEPRPVETLQPLEEVIEVLLAGSCRREAPGVRERDKCPVSRLTTPLVDRVHHPEERLPARLRETLNLTPPPWASRCSPGQFYPREPSALGVFNFCLFSGVFSLLR